MRLDYAEFLELEMLSRFGAVPDARVKARLARGARLRAMLSQPQYAPPRLADEVGLAWALRDGVLDDVAPDKIAELRAALPAWLDQHAGPAVQTIEASRQAPAEQRDHLAAALRGLSRRYASAHRAL